MTFKDGCVVAVERGGLEPALKRLRERVATAGLVGELKRRQRYESPSVRRRAKDHRAWRRRRNAELCAAKKTRTRAGAD